VPRQYEWLIQLSKDPNNTVIGLVRDKSATDAKIKADATLGTRSNVYILEADLTDYNAIKVSPWPSLRGYARSNTDSLGSESRCRRIGNHQWQA
jgi:hypothetical protein